VDDQHGARNRRKTVHTHHHQQTPDALRTPSFAHQHSNWQTRAIAAYHRCQPDETELRLKLTSAVQMLTSRTVETDAIVIDPAGRTASVRVDGVLFRWADNQLIVLRPCAYCGLGVFTSPPVRGAEELGFALGAWQPLHNDCQPSEADAID
jgi:hypothetical protein